jgi:hypothetical protein
METPYGITTTADVGYWRVFNPRFQPQGDEVIGSLLQLLSKAVSVGNESRLQFLE